jgi:hypothetical protein
MKVVNLGNVKEAADTWFTTNLIVAAGDNDDCGI